MSLFPCSYDHLFKLIIVGDAGVGKSNLTRVFTSTGFHAIPKPTIGVDFAIKYMEADHLRPSNIETTFLCSPRWRMALFEHTYGTRQDRSVFVRLREGIVQESMALS